MEHIFSPWRMEYILSDKENKDCILCKFVGETDDLKNLIVYRGIRAYVILNRYPYTSGHLMVVPHAHQPSLELLDPVTRSEMMELTSRALEVLGGIYQPGGFNVGINIGTAAGAGISNHVHMHVVPRWGGDTNFMTALGDVRVLPEALEDTCRRVMEAWGM
jgi:ATP adenylyltransferase